MKPGTDINFASELLKNGKVVAIPTETVYGLAANAFDPEAVIQIFEIKNRPRFNPLIVHIDSWQMLNRIAPNADKVLKLLAEKFWPGPLTILAPKTELIHPIVTAGSELVAIRMPDHPIALELLKMLEFPLAAPSANLFGKISPTTAQHVEAELGNKLDYILDGGDCIVGVESTIIKVDSIGKVVILRPGGISAEQIAEIIGYPPDIADSNTVHEAPGMLKSHYAPIIPLLIGDPESLIDRHNKKRIAVISYFCEYNQPSVFKNYTLSAQKNLHEAAKNLFAAMHDAENSGAEIIISELFPNHGIGMAINDRLKRAASL